MHSIACIGDGGIRRVRFRRQAGEGQLADVHLLVAEVAFVHDPIIIGLGVIEATRRSRSLGLAQSRDVAPCRHPSGQVSPTPRAAQAAASKVARNLHIFIVLLFLVVLGRRRPLFHSAELCTPAGREPLTDLFWKEVFGLLASCRFVWAAREGRGGGG